jgi:hypothetical protein
LQTGRRQGSQLTNSLDIGLVQLELAHLLEHLIFIHSVSCTLFAFRMVSAPPLAANGQSDRKRN